MSTTLRDSQWDIRVNVPTAAALTNLLNAYNALWQTGKIRYITVSGVEQTPNTAAHVHVALVLNNPTSKASIVNHFILDRTHGYHVQKRDRKRSFQDWLAYHRKVNTKKDPNELILMEEGNQPRDRRADYQSLSEREEVQNAARQKRFNEWKERRALMESEDWDTLDYKFPGFRWSSAGMNMQREVLKQKTNELNQPLNGPLNNWIIWGPTGTGKSSSVNLLYPNAYKKQKGSQFWDGYDLTNPDHGVVWIDEFSKETLKTIAGKPDGGFEFLKELCDRYPVTVDEKYTKGYKIRPKSVIITMNEHPVSLLPARAIEVNKAALFRKCKILYVDDWLALNNLKCTTEGCVSIDDNDVMVEQIASLIELDN